MSNQTISEAARKAAKEMWFDAELTARITGLYSDWERCAAPHIQSAIDAATEPIDARIREIFKSNPTLKNFAEELARYRDAAARENPCSKIFDHKWLDPKCVEKGCQSLAARVEPTDKDEELDKMHDELHKMIQSSVFGWPDGENSKAHQLLYKIKRHSRNASLPATPTPQGETSAETGPPNCVLCGKPPHTDSCGHSYLPPKEIYAERETKSGASLGAATDKGERFS